MIKNPQNAWLAMLIFKAMWIPGIHKSPAELLNFRKYHTNLPMIDLNQKVHEPELKNLVDKHQNATSTGKELPKLDFGQKYYMRNILMLQKSSILNGLRVQLKIEKTLENITFWLMTLIELPPGQDIT